MHFGAPSRGLRTPCERFAPWVTPGPRITRFRLVADLGRMGLDTHRGSNKVSKITSRHLVPLDRAFPAHALVHGAESMQHQLRRILVKTERPGNGFIGERADDKIRRLPSALYWSSLTTLSLLAGAQMADRCLKRVPAGCYVSRFGL